VELILSTHEQELLKEVLEEHHRELLLEISRTDHHDFKRMLKDKEQVVESLLERLGTRELAAH